MKGVKKFLSIALCLFVFFLIDFRDGRNGQVTRIDEEEIRLSRSENGVYEMKGIKISILLLDLIRERVSNGRPYAEWWIEGELLIVAYDSYR